MGLLEKGILNLRDLIILSAEGLQRVNSIQKKLNDVILLEFASCDDLGTQKESKKDKSFVGNFKTKKSKHWISGLDREIVYGCGLVSYVVPVLDGSSSVGQERAPPFGVI